MTEARLLLACANAVVASLNLLAWRVSNDPRDMWAAIAWAGSTGFWLWGAVAL